MADSDQPAQVTKDFPLEVQGDLLPGMQGNPAGASTGPDGVTVTPTKIPNLTPDQIHNWTVPDASFVLIDAKTNKPIIGADGQVQMLTGATVNGNVPELFEQLKANPDQKTYTLPDGRIVPLYTSKDLPHTTTLVNGVPTEVILSATPETISRTPGTQNGDRLTEKNPDGSYKSDPYENGQLNGVKVLSAATSITLKDGTKVPVTIEHQLDTTGIPGKGQLSDVENGSGAIQSDIDKTTVKSATVNIPTTAITPFKDVNPNAFRDGKITFDDPKSHIEKGQSTTEIERQRFVEQTKAKPGDIVNFGPFVPNTVQLTGEGLKIKPAIGVQSGGADQAILAGDTTLGYSVPLGKADAYNKGSGVGTFFVDGSVNLENIAHPKLGAPKAGVTAGVRLSTPLLEPDDKGVMRTTKHAEYIQASVGASLVPDTQNVDVLAITPVTKTPINQVTDTAHKEQAGKVLGTETVSGNNVQNGTTPQTTTATTRETGTSVSYNGAEVGRDTHVATTVAVTNGTPNLGSVERHVDKVDFAPNGQFVAVGDAKTLSTDRTSKQIGTQVERGETTVERGDPNLSTGIVITPDLRIGSTNLHHALDTGGLYYDVNAGVQANIMTNGMGATPFARAGGDLGFAADNSTWSLNVEDRQNLENGKNDFRAGLKFQVHNNGKPLSPEEHAKLVANQAALGIGKPLTPETATALSQESVANAPKVAKEHQDNVATITKIGVEPVLKVLNGIAESDSGGRDFASAVKKLQETNTLTPEALAKEAELHLGGKLTQAVKEANAKEQAKAAVPLSPTLAPASSTNKSVPQETGVGAQR